MTDEYTKIKKMAEAYKQMWVQEQMKASGFFTPSDPNYEDDDAPNFPDDDSLNPGGYDLGRLT